MLSRLKNKMKTAVKTSTTPPSFRYIVEEDTNESGKKVYRTRKNQGTVVNQAVDDDNKFDAVAFMNNPLKNTAHYKTVTPKRIRSERFSRQGYKLLRGTKTVLGSTLVPLTKGVVTKMVYEPAKGLTKGLVYNPLRAITEKTGIGKSVIKDIDRATAYAESGKIDKYLSNKLDKKLGKSKIAGKLRGGNKTKKTEKHKLYKYH